MQTGSPQIDQDKLIQEFAELGLISESQAQTLLASGHQPLRELIKYGWVSETDYARTVSAGSELEYLGVDQVPEKAIIDTDELHGFLHDNEALPLVISDGVLKVAVTDPSALFIVQVLKAKLGYEVNLCVMQRGQLLDALGRLYPLPEVSGSSGGKPSQMQTIKQANGSSSSTARLEFGVDSDSQLVREVHRLLQRAVAAQASDIHFEPVGASLRVRFRVHGLLRTVHTFAPEYASQAIARLKLMAKLDVSEKRRAQNGRFQLPADGRSVDLRVSTLPLQEGESVVLRLLQSELSQKDLPELGFPPAIVEELTRAMNAQHGMMLVTGPTGSGKSTTLYALLNYLNQTELKLVSIEDPVEMKMQGVNQIQVNDEHGLSFADALRSVLRQDPDVIMVGEIRDAQTASLAAQAALTGHLVLATLHTSEAATAFARLKNLGLPDYLQAATVRTVLAQRLLRVRCVACAKTAANPGQVCTQCYASRYSGRRVVAELIPYNALQRLAKQDSDSWANTGWPQHLLNGVGMSDDARKLLSLGVTDTAEIYRVLGELAETSHETSLENGNEL